MIARATTTITIYRGQTTDEWGDPIDSSTIVGTGIVASLQEQSQYSRGEITTQPRTFRYARLRVDSSVDIQYNDRIKDEITGWIWTIRNLSNYQNPVRQQDTRADLQRTVTP
jgi:hypothetical protein